jgi:hypothetical protein
MIIQKQIARHIREIHFGKNWTWVNLLDTLKDVTYIEATQKIEDFNTIASLVFHMNFYLKIVKERINGRIIKFKHEESFIHPPIKNESDWLSLLKTTYEDAEAFASLVEEMEEETLWKEISKEYGNYYRNINGVVEHNHYHLGQIIILKKLLR